MKRSALFLAASLVLTAAVVLAQYSVDWHKIAAGGGTSTGGSYALRGTIGQAEATGPLTGGNYTLTAGFWSAVIPAPVEGSPALTITANTGGTVTVRWPSPSPGWLPEQSTSLSSGWTPSTWPVTDDGIFRSQTFPPPAGRLFIRLRK